MQLAVMPNIAENQIVKIVIIEDVRDLREGLAMLIGGTAGFECVGRFRSVEEAIAKIGFHPPNIVLTDIGLPGMDGIEGIKILREKYPEISFIALTVYDDDERIFDALCAGAVGYLLKNTQPARLLEALREVSAGGAPNVAGSCAARYQFVPKLRPAENFRLSSHTAGKRIIKTAGCRTQLQNRRVSFGNQLSHGFIPSPQRL